MGAHEHSLSCLKTAGHILYCEVTGDVGLELPKPKPVAANATVLQFPAKATFTPPSIHQAVADRTRFTIYGPDEKTRSGGALAYPYSMKTFEMAKAKALEILARKTRTPYLSIVSYVPGEKTIRTKIERSALGPDPTSHYVFYPGYARDAGIEAQTLPAIKKLAEAHLKKHPEKSEVHVYVVTPGRGSPTGKQATTVLRPSSGTGEIPKDVDRNTAIRLIKEGLKKRSGKDWSVTGGTGTAWGWIRISSPPSRQRDNYMTETDMAELGQLLALGRPAHHQYESIAASSGHRTEYIDRAWGRKPSKYGEQYWD